MVHLRRTWLIPFAATLALAGPGCSDEPVLPDLPGAPSDAPTATPELAAYGIDPYEAVASEGDPALAGDADYPRPTDDDPSDLVFLDGGDPEAPAELELEDVEDMEEIGEEGLGPASLRPLAAGTLPGWWTKTFPLPYRIVNDPRNRVGKRICRGSPFNCPVPNPHADANRLHPRSARDTFYRSDRQKEALERYNDSGFRAKIGATVYEGGGRPLGHLSAAGARAVKVNFGVLRAMNVGAGKETFLYGWAVHTDRGTASGWIRKADFEGKPGGELDRGTKKATPPRKPKGLAEEEWYVLPATELGTCSVADYDASPDKPCLSKLDRAKGGVGRFSELKVIPNERGKNGKVGDYLLRSKSILNLAYATPRLGGPSLDSRYVGAGVPFHRVMSPRDSKQKATLLSIPLFEAGKKAVVGKMLFAYGRFDDTYGWVALDAIKKGRAPGGLFDCAGKADGFHCEEVEGRGAYLCRGGAFTGEVPTCRPGERCTSPAGAPALVCAP